MIEHNIAAPLAAALAAKGYASLTAVQTAVLADDTAGRDMLVSAQTGSGKTVAFGLAIANDLLDGDQLPQADTPIALAIAPTRELALQVARELEWLYADAGARIATCVGGMDFRAEKRALDRGAHIVVGTPGRLRDHIERASLDLTQLRAAVLDEADEMLDLGFRDDLEFILRAAPEERRTLMFSATVPSEIEALARDFQRDAKRIVAKGEARQHGDIEYRALNVNVRDREPAIFNLLRLTEARTSIIFCKTRVNVTHLLARLSNRGFRAVALSGELSQQERTHALQSLRDGRAQVCVATDVAARGIDLPGLELVIHADLPTNPDVLLHRSGRTGRAGSKGVSALIVVPADRKKAQSLLKRARLEAEWGPAPSADEVRASDDARLNDKIAQIPVDEDDVPLLDGLLAQFDGRQLAGALLALWREGRPAPEELSVIQERAAPEGPRAPRDMGETVWFTLSVGHTGRAEPRWLLPKICDAGNLTRDAIGAIRIRHEETFVQITAAEAATFGRQTEIQEGLIMTRLDQAPDLEGGPRSAPAPRGDRPRFDKPRGEKSWGEKSGGEKSWGDKPRAEKTWGDKPRAEKPATDWQRPARDDAPRPQTSFDPIATEDKPRKKARWSTEERAAQRAAAPRDDAAKDGDAKFDGKPARKPAGKPAGKPGFGKPAFGKAGKPAPRKPFAGKAGADAAPRRSKGPK